MSAAEHQQTIFSEFARNVPGPWVRGEIAYRRAGRTAEATMRALAEDGGEMSVSGGMKLTKAIRALREEMAQPGAGAWLSAAITLTPNGQFTMDVDYDNEPAWKIPIVADTYAEEQQLFPRDEEHQPEWFKQKLRIARGD